MAVSHIVGHPWWWARARLGKTPATEDETWLRLRAKWNGRAGKGKKIFKFPWGELQYLDYGQMLGQFRDIFLRKNYSFRAATKSPTIVDCGGNIGLSAIWFKKTYPGCELTVYEASPAISEVLQNNLEGAGLGDVVMRNKAVWIHNGMIGFEANGPDSGKLSKNSAAQVSAIDLASELPERVDLLKLDIEGAEYPVLNRLCETGAIDRIQAVVAEFHVWRSHIDEMLGALKRIRDAGMMVSFAAEPCPWIGSAARRSPFEAIGDFEMLMMVYGWRQTAEVA